MSTNSIGSGSRPPLVARILDILLRPRQTWPQIDGEDGSVSRIYKDYLVYLAAVPAIAQFVGLSLIGVGAFGIRVRVPLFDGLVGMVAGYLMSLVMVYVAAWIAGALAPHFGGRQDIGSALKLVAYGATAGMLGGVFSLLPPLAVLGLFTALYSIYLIYTGAPVLMRLPEQRAVGYTAVLVVCGIVAGLLIGMLTTLFTPGANPFGDASNSMRITVPGADIAIDTGRIDAAGRALEEAQSRGDAGAAAQAIGELAASALGGQAQPAFAAQQLGALVPDTFAGQTRSSIEAGTLLPNGLMLSANGSGPPAELDRQLQPLAQRLGALRRTH